MPEIGYQKSTGLASWQSLTDEAMETNPDLAWPAFIEVYDRMRNEDAQVGSVLRAVTLPIRSTRWYIDPAGAKIAHTKQIAEDFGLPIKGRDPKPPKRMRDRFSWNDHTRMALLMLVYGHSYFEQVYDVESERGKTHLKKLAWRPPRTIQEIKVERDGGLVGIKQHEVDRLIPVDRLVAYINEREGANWLGRSLLRQAYKDWLLKDRALRGQALTIERNGMGVPVYTGAPFPDGADASEREEWLKTEKDSGLTVTKGFKAGEAAGASITPGAKLELKGVDGRLPDIDKPIRYYDEQIARAVLAHFLNLGTETGSWALGSTFADFFTNSLNAVARDLCDITNQHVIEDLVDENWGPDAAAPRLVFEEIGSSSPATAEAIKQLIECKAIHPDEDIERFMRQTYGLPPLKNKDAKRIREEREAAPIGEPVDPEADPEDPQDPPTPEEES
jgi:hypothetical protein